jgi:hypothetical protein
MTALELGIALASLAVGLVNLLLIFGLTSRLRALERVARQRDLPPQLPQPGHVVLPFEVASTTGAVVSAASLSAHDRALVCFVTSGCSKCQAIEARLVADPPALPVVSFIYGDLAEAQALAGQLGRVGPVAIFESHRVTEAFGAVNFPTLVRLEHGVVAAAGRTLEEVMSR